MADITEDLRLPSLAQVKTLIKTITASDVGAVSDLLFFSSGSIKEIALANKSLLAMVSNGVSDMPIDNQWWAIETNQRGGALCKITATSIFDDITFVMTYQNGIWTDWKDISGDFKSDGSVPMTGSLQINGDWKIVRLVNSAGDREAYFQLAPNGGFQITEKPLADMNNYISLQMLGHDSTQDIAYRLKLNHVLDGALESYNMFGENNKPTGSYTGNGSGITREIAVPSIGDTIIIRRSTSGQVGNTVAIVTKGCGAICKTGTTLKAFTDSQVGFVDGKLVLMTDDAILNENGVIYKYQVI